MTRLACRENWTCICEMLFIFSLAYDLSVVWSKNAGDGALVGFAVRVTVMRDIALSYSAPIKRVRSPDARLYCRGEKVDPHRWVKVNTSYHECSEQQWGLISVLLTATLLPPLHLIRCTCATATPGERQRACVTLGKWMATDRPTSTWGARYHSPALPSKGRPSVLAAGITACSRGSRDTSATVASRIAPARSASWSSRGSGWWQRRWLLGGSRRTRVWRASSRSPWEYCRVWPWPGAERAPRARHRALEK